MTLTTPRHSPVGLSAPANNTHVSTNQAETRVGGAVPRVRMNFECSFLVFGGDRLDDSTDFKIFRRCFQTRPAEKFLSTLRSG